MTNLLVIYYSVVLLIGITGRVGSTSTRRHRAPDEVDIDDHAIRSETIVQPNVAGFEKIEDYLQGHVKSEETRPNMEAAKKLLAEQQTKPAAEFDRELSDALRMFVNLEKLDMDTTCNHYGYDFLVELKAATKYRIDRRTTKRRRFIMPLKRIELLMSRYALIHAKQCQIVYRNRFAGLISEYDLTKLESIDAFIRALASDHQGQHSKIEAGTSKPRRVYHSLIEKTDSLKGTRDAKLLVDLMSASGDEFRNVAGDELKNRARAWFTNRLIGPCRDYLTTMKKDVFMPAELDSRIMDRADKVKPGSGEQPDGFIFGWVRYGLCTILERDQYVLIKNAISLLDRQKPGQD